VFTALESLALTTTTFILQEKRNHPEYPAGFVTIPDTEQHLGNAREASDAYLLGYVPTVQGKDFGLWSNYTQANKDWMVDAWDAYITTAELNGQDVDLTLIAKDEEERESFFSEIWDLIAYDGNGNVIVDDPSKCHDQELETADHVEHVLEDPKDGPASPIWMTSPPPEPGTPSRINFNLRSSPVFDVTVATVQQYRTPTFHDLCETTKVRPPRISIFRLRTLRLDMPCLIFVSFSFFAP
jgi:hypothetical protein